MPHIRSNIKLMMDMLSKLRKNPNFINIASFQTKVTRCLTTTTTTTKKTLQQSKAEIWHHKHASACDILLANHYSDHSASALLYWLPSRNSHQNSRLKHKHLFKCNICMISYLGNRFVTMSSGVGEKNIPQHPSMSLCHANEGYTVHMHSTVQSSRCKRWTSTVLGVISCVCTYCSR